MTKENEITSVKLGDKTYSMDSLTERGNNLLQDIQKLDGLLAHQQLTVSVSQLAKGKLVEELTKESEHFTEIEEEK